MMKYTNTGGGWDMPPADNQPENSLHKPPHNKNHSMKHYNLYTIKRFLNLALCEEHPRHRGQISAPCRGQLIMPCYSSPNHILSY